MPLLQHALARLWDLRHGRWLRREAWRQQIGGVAGALEKTAEDVWGRLSEADRARMPRLMTGLARVGSGGGPDTRRRATLRQLVPMRADAAEREAIRRLVSHLAGEGARLLVVSHDALSGEDRAEVAHEALLRHWKRLRRWLDEAREMLLLMEDLRASAQAWVNARKEGEAWLEHRGVRGEALRAMQKTQELELEEEPLRCLASPLVVGTVAEYVAACEAADRMAAERRKYEEQRLTGALLAAAVRARLVARDRVGAAALLAEASDPAVVPDYATLALAALEHPLPTLRVAQEAPVRAVVWAPDGASFWTGTADGKVRRWSANHGEPLGAEDVSLLEEFSVGAPVRSLSVHPGGGLLAVRTAQMTLLYREGRVAVVMGYDPVVALFSPCGRYLLVARYCFGRVFSMAELLARLEGGGIPADRPSEIQRLLGHSGVVVPEGAVYADDLGQEIAYGAGEYVQAGAFSPDGDRFVLGSGGAPLRYYLSETGEIYRVEPEERANVVVWGAEGIAAASESGIHWFDPDGTSRGRCFDAGAVNGMCLSPDGRVLLTGSAEGTVRSYLSVATPAWTAPAEGVPSYQEGARLQFQVDFGGLSLGPDGTVLLTASSDGTVCGWSVSARPPLLPAATYPRVFRSGGFEGVPVWSADLRHVAWQDSEGRLQMRRDKEPIPSEILGRPLVFDPAGMLLLVALMEEGLLVLDLRTGRERALELPPNAVVSQATWNGGRFALCLEDGRIGVAEDGGSLCWLDLELGVVKDPVQARGWLVGKISPFESLSMSAVACAVDGSGRQRLLQHLADPEEPRGLLPVTALAIHPAGLEVTVAYTDFLAVTSGLEEGRRERTRSHGHFVTAAAYSPDGAFLATGCDDKLLRIWGEEESPVVLAGHSEAPSWIGWTGDSAAVVSASRDGTVRVWDPRTRAERLMLLPGFPIGDLRVDGQTIAVISDDRFTIAVWSLNANFAAELRAAPKLSASERRRWLGM